MSKRTNIQFLYDSLRKNGFEPLFTEYKSSREPLSAICPLHGNFQTSGLMIKRGHGCAKCGRITYALKRRGDIQEVAQMALSLGLTLLDIEFPSQLGFQILKFECSVHGIFSQEHTYFMRRKTGCSKCGHIKGGVKNQKSHDIFEKELFLIRPEYKLLSTYTSSSGKVKVGCPIHGEFDSKADGLLGGHGCPKCGNRSLGTQNEIANIIKNLVTSEVLENNRNIVKPLELDIYVPEKKLAIEYCGVYWHTEDKKGKFGHKKKLLECRKLNIDLITIFSDEWIEKESQVTNVLKAKLGVLPKIGARDCEVREISKEDAKHFLDSFHLQGYSASIYHLGLFYENVLVGVMTGGRHPRGGKGDTIVLNRLCFGSYSVMGGASKLFKKFKAQAKALKYSKIISWSDNRWSNGGVYRALNFNLEDELGPDYSYIKGKKRLSKQSCQKKHLLAKGAVGTTETEMALSLGYAKIWDCGKKRWTFNI